MALLATNCKMDGHEDDKPCFLVKSLAVKMLGIAALKSRLLHVVVVLVVNTST